MAGLSATAGLYNRPYSIVRHSLARAAMKVFGASSAAGLETVPWIVVALRVHGAALPMSRRARPRASSCQAVKQLSREADLSGRVAGAPSLLINC
jgi:hypothetical protein